MRWKLRLLFVDDFVEVAEMLALMAGKALPFAVADHCAFPVMSRLPLYDVLTTDVRLGRDIDGVQLAEEYKRLNPAGRVILVTGLDMKAPAVADAVFTKPLTDLRRFMSTIEGWFGSDPSEGTVSCF